MFLKIRYNLYVIILLLYVQEKIFFFELNSIFMIMLHTQILSYFRKFYNLFSFYNLNNDFMDFLCFYQFLKKDFFP